MIFMYVIVFLPACKDRIFYEKGNTG